MLIAMDVTTNDGLEEEFDLFRTATKEANTIFNYEEFGITTLFTYLRIPIQRLVARLNANSTNVQADISRVLHQFESVLVFLTKTFPKFEPSCVGAVARVLVDLTELHDYFAKVDVHSHCEDLVSLIYSLTEVIGENIGNVTVQTNMQAYCASRMFTTLLPSGFSLAQFLKTIHSKDVLVMPCLYPMAVALSFSREIIQKISTNKPFVVDESSYRNVSSMPLKLRVFNVEFDALILQPTSVLAMVILSPDGSFLDNVFSLLVLSFISVGFREEQLARMKNEHATHQKQAHGPTPSRIATTHTKSVPRLTNLNFTLSKQPTNDAQTISTSRQMGLSSPRLASPRVVSSPRLASPRIVVSPRITSPRTPHAVSPRIAQFASQRTRSVENLAAVAAAPSSRVQPFSPEEDASPSTTRSPAAFRCISRPSFLARARTRSCGSMSRGTSTRRALRRSSS